MCIQYVYFILRPLYFSLYTRTFNWRVTFLVDTNVTCNWNEFFCGADVSGDPFCVDTQFVCDGIINCPSGLDEAGCVYGNYNQQ